MSRLRSLRAGDGEHVIAAIRRTALVAVLLLSSAASAQQRPPGSMPDAREMMRWSIESFLYSELLEYVPGAAGNPVRYDLLAWVGGAYDRVWVKADGSQATLSGDGSTMLQLLWGRLITPFWDAQIGLRMDVGYGSASTRTRLAAAVGVQGLATGWFELEPTLFVSFRGDVSASLIASYDMLLTQRLVLQPRLETAVAVQSVPEFGIGAGFNDVQLGVRLRYELIREVAPYVGVAWQRLLMETATLARAAGEPVGEVSFVAGLRLWY